MTRIHAISRVGILGAGQLGRMLALAGYPLGLRFRLFDPTEGAPGGHVAELRSADWTDEEALRRFADGLDVVTYEFENVPVLTVEMLAAVVRIHPGPAALRVAQSRLEEKHCFARLGIRTPRFAPVDTRADLEDAVAQIGLPSVLKTQRMGYDGRGQAVLRGATDVEPAWNALGGVPLVLEQFIEFDRELSVIAVRAAGGEIEFYPLVENEHRGGILHRSIAPAPGVSTAMRTRAYKYITQLLETLDYVGVLALELFQDGDELLANEMAPRVHNSGHWTIEGAATSQFENHLRAILGLPLGATHALGEIGMVNLIGEVPAAAEVLAIPEAHLHLYGKRARPGRKLGHVTVRARDEAELRERLERVAALVERAPAR